VQRTSSFLQYLFQILPFSSVLFAFLPFCTHSGSSFKISVILSSSFWSCFFYSYSASVDLSRHSSFFLWDSAAILYARWPHVPISSTAIFHARLDSFSLGLTTIFCVRFDPSSLDSTTIFHIQFESVSLGFLTSFHVRWTRSFYSAQPLSPVLQSMLKV
jgi:hypothetical protein